MTYNWSGKNADYTFNEKEINLLSDLVRNELQKALKDSDKEYIQLLNWLAVKLEVQK